MFEVVVKAQPNELGCFLFFGGPLIFIYFCVYTLPVSTKEGGCTYSAVSHKTKGNPK